jgi:hypothetical protein
MKRLALLAGISLLASIVACSVAPGTSERATGDPDRSVIPALTDRPASTESLPPSVDSLSGTTACEATFSAVRCRNMTVYAAAKLNVSPDEIFSLGVLPPPTPELVDGQRVLITLSGAAPVDTLLALADGSVHEVSMDCAGIPGFQCLDDPRLQATSPTIAGYRDVPCDGEPPAGCASPVPPPDPEARAAAKELRVPRLDIPIDRVGHYEIAVGEATLPNGILTTAEFAFASPEWPSDFTIAEGVVQLSVRSLDHPERLFWNIYDHGWIEGTERVEAILEFDVLHQEPGATFSVEDVVVR